jgi:hypothetical protein
MGKLLLCILIFSSFSSLVYSQDTIVKVGGGKILCKIEKEDSVKLYYSLDNKGYTVNSFINKSEVESFKYGEAQKTESNGDVVSLGVGLGMDFGGIGANLTFYPQKNIGIFGGVGYAIAGTGYNVGIKIRYLSDKSQLSPFFSAMYGYNAAIAVIDESRYNKLFYGITFGIGMDIYTGKRNYWSVALHVPIRGSEVEEYMDDLENNHNIEFKNGLWPIGFSVGYRFVID